MNQKAKTYFPFKNIGKYAANHNNFESSFNQMIEDLSKHGRSITNGPTARALSHRMRDARQKGIIYFSWDKYLRKSIVTLKPGYKIKRTSPKKIQLIPPNTPLF